MMKTKARRTALYRHWRSDGTLLYVGISKDPVARTAQHHHSAAWYPLIASITVEWFATRPEAERAEADAIADELPKYNVKGAEAVPPKVRIPRDKGPIERLAFSPAEAAQALGISRAKLYQLLDDGTIPSLKLGRRRLIRREALLDVVSEVAS